MALVEKIISFKKKKYSYLVSYSIKNLKIQSPNIFVIFAVLLFFSFIFFTFFNLIDKKNKKHSHNLQEITKSNEFSNLGNFFINRIISPYEEVSYLVQNNDTVEKILKKFNVRTNDIKNVTVKLKEQKLSNIYSGKKLSLIIKKLNENTNTLVSFVYPVNNTTSVEVRKSQDNFIIKENILQLYKKEVVIKNTIKNNLYSSAISAGIQPNIIIEFARIFGFEVDFQRDIRKGDWFEILYEKFEDDNNKVRDTGKIIYASMFVNGNEINLYNFKYNNVEDHYDIKGKSITKSLMKTPINGARLSSSFGMRKHPILG